MNSLKYQESWERLINRDLVRTSMRSIYSRNTRIFYKLQGKYNEMKTFYMLTQHTCFWIAFVI